MILVIVNLICLSNVPVSASFMVEQDDAGNKAVNIIVEHTVSMPDKELRECTSYTVEELLKINRRKNGKRINKRS